MDDFKIQLNQKGHLRRRESYDLEFKQAFHFGDSLLEYLRSLVGMANNRGGRIVFGIQDKPHLPIGLKNDKFAKLDPTKINAKLLECFSSDINYTINSFSWNGLEFGELVVAEASSKPIVCRKTCNNVLREGAIYYRYRGETKEIRYAELNALLQAEKDKEKALWMSHIEKIGSVGPRDVHILDTAKGELNIGDGSILVDQSVIDQIKFIREGEFVEKKGAPALKMVGEISGVVDADNVIYAESAYPFTTGHVLTECGINQYEFQALAWKYGFKNDVRFHTMVSTGKKSRINKYSQVLIDFIRDEIRRDCRLVERAKKEYSASKKS